MSRRQNALRPPKEIRILVSCCQHDDGGDVQVADEGANLQGVPRNNLDLGAGLCFIPAIHQNGGPRLIAGEAAPLVQAAGSVLCGRRTRFDFDGLQAPVLFNEQIDLMSGSVAPETQVGRAGRTGARVASPPSTTANLRADQVFTPIAALLLSGLEGGTPWG